MVYRPVHFVTQTYGELERCRGGRPPLDHHRGLPSVLVPRRKVSGGTTPLVRNYQKTLIKFWTRQSRNPHEVTRVLRSPAPAKSCPQVFDTCPVAHCYFLPPTFFSAGSLKLRYITLAFQLPLTFRPCFTGNLLRNRAAGHAPRRPWSKKTGQW